MKLLMGSQNKGETNSLDEMGKMGCQNHKVGWVLETYIAFINLFWQNRFGVYGGCQIALLQIFFFFF